VYKPGASSPPSSLSSFSFHHHRTGLTVASSTMPNVNTRSSNSTTPYIDRKTIANMSSTHSRISKWEEDAAEGNIHGFTCQPPTTDPQCQFGPTSAYRSGCVFPDNEAILEDIWDNDGSDDDEGVFEPLFSSSFVDRLTISSGGVEVGSHPSKISIEIVYTPPSSSVPCSSSSSGQLGRIMTPKEIEHWACAHNWAFLQSLSNSIAAHNLAADPQSPVVYHPMVSSTLYTPSPGSLKAASRGPSRFVSTGHRSIQPSLTTPLPSPSSAWDPQSARTRTQRLFRPNNMVLGRMGLPAAPLLPVHPEGNYLSHRYSSSNAREVQGLQDFENCALFLTKIPVKATLQEIFSVITTGAVFCLHLNPPNSIHTTMAAKLVFMTPEAAYVFLKEIQSPRGVILQGQRIQGRYNRNGYVRNDSNWQSRVLDIVGPTPIMTREYWTTHFSMFSEFELEACCSIPTNINGVTIMQFRFARIDGQAQTCLQCIRTDPSLAGTVQVRYGVDPCGNSAAP
jgi:hypothetical protein